MQQSHSIKQNSPILVISLMVFGLSLAMCLIFTETQVSKKQAVNFNLNSWQIVSGESRRYMNSPLSYEVVSNSSPKHSMLELLSPNSPVIVKIRIPKIHVPRSKATRSVITKLDNFSQNLFANISKQTAGVWISNLASNQSFLEQDNAIDYSVIKSFDKLASNQIIPVTGLYLEEQGQKVFNFLALNTNGSFLHNSSPVKEINSQDLYATMTVLSCQENCGQVLGISDKKTWLSLKQSVDQNFKLLTDMLLGRFDTNTNTLLREGEKTSALKNIPSSIANK